MQLDPGHNFQDVLKVEELEDAYEVLTDAARRKEYDATHSQKAPSNAAGVDTQAADSTSKDAGDTATVQQAG